MHDLASLHTLLAPLFPGLMGVQLDEVSAERMVAAMTVRPDSCTGGSILHGGACMACADTPGAVGTVINLPPGRSTTTADSRSRLIAGASPGSMVRGESLALHRGRGLSPGWRHP